MSNKEFEKSCTHRASFAARWTLAFALLATPRVAGAVTRSCGTDAVANTTNVLCASPSGPCDSTTVRLSENVEVPTGGLCAFDLGGRNLLVTKGLDVVPSGFIDIANVADVSISSTGKLRARGNFGSGPIVDGGRISLHASGTITHDGVIDVRGNPAGLVELEAAGDVTLDTGSELLGSGLSSGSNDERYADGGSVQIVSTGGSVVQRGTIALDGQSLAAGGSITVEAARDVDVTTPIDAEGGEAGGGTIEITAGDDVSIDARLSAQGASNGGDGGSIDLDAGDDSLGGVVTGGQLTVTDGPLRVDGSTATSSMKGSGGSFTARSNGTLFLGLDSSIKASAATTSDGAGGFVSLDSGDRSDLSVYGTVLARGGSGGQFEAVAGRNLLLANDVDVNGAFGGILTGTARGTVQTSKGATASGVGTSGHGGLLQLQGCALNVTAQSTIEAIGGGTAGEVLLIGGNDLTVASASHVRATGAFGTIRLATALVGGTCSHDPGILCDTSADCGGGGAQCQNLNPDTGGTTTQFTPGPEIVEDPTVACP